MPYHVGAKGSYGCSGYPAVKEDGEVMGCHDTKEQAQAQIYAINQSEGNIDEKDTVTNDGGVGIKDPEEWPKMKKNAITEGSFVMGQTTEGIVHGRVEHIMWEGGTLGMPGEEYAIESMPPENPAMSVRIFEYEVGEGWEPTAYSIGMMYQDATLVDKENHVMENEDQNEEYDKAEELDKKAPCWEGYVMVGMKPGRNGQPVPNCVPAKKAKFLTEPFI